MLLFAMVIMTCYNYGRVFHPLQHPYSDLMNNRNAGMKKGPKCNLSNNLLHL